MPPNTIEKDLARSDWIPIFPGSIRPTTLTCEQNLREAYLIIAATTNGNPADYVYLQASDLKLLIE